MCWNRHEDKITEKAIRTSVIQKNITKSSSTEKMEKCFDCGETFRRKSEMLLHRKSEHPENVKSCKDPVNCEFTRCAFIHKLNFPKGLKPPKPPRNQENPSQD